MNRVTFLKTLFGIAVLPSVLVKIVQVAPQSKATIPGGVPYAKLKEMNDYLNERICRPPYNPEAAYLWEHDARWNRCSNAECNIYRPKSPEKVLPILFHRCKL